MHLLFFLNWRTRSFCPHHLQDPESWAWTPVDDLHLEVVGLLEHSWTFAPLKDSRGWGWTVRGLGWVSGSDWGSEKGTERTNEEQQQPRRTRKEEKEEAIPVTQDLLALRTLPSDPKALEIRIVQSGAEGTRWGTNPTGRESGPFARLPV